MPDNTSQPFREEEIMLRLVTPPMDEDRRIGYNIAKEYVVLKYPMAPWGLRVLGRFGADHVPDTWQPPWHDMPVIAEILRQLSTKDTLLADAMKNAERLGNEIMGLHKMCQVREDQLAAKNEQIATLKALLREANEQLVWMPGTTGVALREKISEALK